MVSDQEIVAWLAAFVALWWAFDWLQMRQRGLSVPLRRAPLRALGDVLPRLWRNRTFLLALLCLWLIGAAVASVQSYLFSISAEAQTSRAGPLVSRLLSATQTVPELLCRELPEALPRLVEVPLGTWGGMLFVALLAVGLIRVIVDPPQEIGQETARKLRWPAALLVLYLAAGTAILAAPREFIESFGYGAAVPPPRTILFSIGTLVLMPVLLAPAYGLLWRLVLEIVRDGVWSFRSSLRALAECWLPIALALAIAKALRPIVVLDRGGYGSAPGLAYLILLVLLALAPWAILDGQAGLIAALQRSWRLFRLRPVDAIAFGLRFALLFAVLGGIVALFEPPAMAEWTRWYAPLLGVVRNGLLLVQAAVLARLYVHLSEELGENTCAMCLVTCLAETLDEAKE